MRPAERHHPLDDLGWGGLGLALVDRWPVFAPRAPRAPRAPWQLEAAFVVVDLRARHAALAAGAAELPSASAS
jgi:hypothetical protein